MDEASRRWWKRIAELFIICLNKTFVKHRSKRKLQKKLIEANFEANEYMRDCYSNELVDGVG